MSMTESGELDLLRQELSRKTAELDHIRQAGVLITSSLDIERILALLMELGLASVNAEVGAIMLQHGATVIPAIAWGVDGDMVQKIALSSGEKLYEAVMREAEPVRVDEAGTDARLLRIDEFAFVRNLLYVPLQTQDKVLGVMIAINKQDDGAFTDSDVGLLTSLSGFASVAIENARLHIEELEKQKMAQELKLANQIQMGLLPCAPPEIPGVVMKGLCFPAKDVGGDYYDYIDLGQGFWAILIADVSSKGAPAALLMSMVRIVFRVVAMESRSPAEIVRKVNMIIYDDMSMTSGMFVTLFLGVLDTTRMVLTYTNAGHCPTILLRRPAEQEPVTLTELKTDDMFIGFDKLWDFHEEKVQLRRGDLLVFFTDGVTDVLNDEDEVFGTARFHALLKARWEMNLTDLSQLIVNDVFGFSGAREENASQYDDFTLVMLRYLS